MSFLLRNSARNAFTAARAFSTSSRASTFAKMTLVGRLTAQPELHATSTGRDILRYGVATEHGARDNRKTSFFNVTSFVPEGGMRDFRMTLEKGTMIYLEAEASMSYYQDGEGKNRNALNLTENKLYVLQYRKPGSESEGEEAAAAAPGQ